MLTYEVKIVIEATSEKEWLHWMKTVHVPDVIATGLPLSYQILKVKDQAYTYVFHYHFASQEAFDHYHQEHSAALQADTSEKFGGKFKAERQLYDWV
ncbi:MAG: DUF4286 family protein [Bacteroidota bacterium]